MSIRTTLFFVSYCTYLLAHGTLAITKCGFPGKPHNGEISLELAIYSENQTVTYKCPRPFTLWYDLGYSRTCSRNGSWTGSIPICMPDVVHKRETITVYPNLPNGSQKKYLVDDLLSPCLELQPVGKTRWVRIGLERKLANTELRVKASVVDTLTNKSTICGSHEGDYSGSPISIHCAATGARGGFPGGIPGDSILIEELTAGNKPLVFCDIEAYAYYGNTDCGLAEAPAFGSAVYVGPKRVEYKCQSGFTLIGPGYRYCDPDGSGTHWPRTTTPTCKLEKWQESFNTGTRCIDLESRIANARIYYKFDRSVAIVECKDGFELVADKVLLCTSFGVWLRYADHGLHCKRKIICSVPPFVANTILANIQDYSEGSQAIYVCRNFAESTYGQRLGISICQANGTWSDLQSKFICQLPTTTTTELTAVTSRSEKSTENLEYLHSTIHSLESACGKIICSEPPSVANTILANIQGYSEGSQATYVCVNFAEPGGQRLGISNCQANGTWSDLPSKFLCQVPTKTTTELVTGTSIRSENLTEYLEYPNSTKHSLVESACESSWKTAFIGTVIGACMSTTLFSILACCYFCKRQQRRKTEDKSYDSMQLQLHVERDKGTGKGYVPDAKGEIQNDPLMSYLDEN